MIRRRYRIQGLDCAACAEKVERHLNEDPAIEEARIDFVNGNLFLSFAEEELSKEEILFRIAEVEDDEVELKEEGEAIEPERFGKEEAILLVRIGLAIACFFLCGFLFRDLYWVRFGMYLATLVLISYDLFVQVVRNIVKRRNPLDEYLLIFVASVGAFVLASLKYAREGQAVAFGNDVFIMEEHYEAILVCLLWQIGELLQEFALRKSRNAVLLAASKKTSDCLLLTEDGPRRVNATEVKEGDKVMVGIHEVVPVDGVVVSGTASCDTSSLTGESLPVAIETGSEVYGGYVLTEGEIEVLAKKDYASSSSARILDLVASSLEKKGEMDTFITRLARVYTPVVFGIAVLYIVLAGLFWSSWETAVFTGLEMLVISCPCALIISVPLAYFASVGLASKNNIVVKSATALDGLFEAKTLISDKTGTLSNGRFTVVEKQVYDPKREEEFAVALSSLESRQQHPLANAIRAYFGSHGTLTVANFDSFAGKGVRGVVDGTLYFAGNAALMRGRKYEVKEEKKEGVYVYLADEEGLIGHLILRDEPRLSAAPMVASLSKVGISTVILSGDKPDSVASFAEKVGVTEYAGGLAPADKLSYLEEKKQSNEHGVLFLGDGINDAPALARADVGIAMGGGGSALACEEADVILLGDDPMGVVKANRIARICRYTIVANIVFALACKLTVMILAILLGERMPMEIAVLADTGVSVLATLHSLLILSRKIEKKSS